MAYIADYNQDFETWDFILGDVYQEMSIAKDRYYYLLDFSYDEKIKISLRDPTLNYWTKWVSFPGLLWKTERDNSGYVKWQGLTAAIDVHRSMLSNEIIIESDHPTYEKNYEAAKIIGEILESKGFIPHYYYSGNKSIHIHVFFDWDCLKDLEIILQDQLRIKFLDSKSRFKSRFIKWLRKKMITCWDTNLRTFDADLINSNHLIRCELSKNKQGYKTFLGYTHKDLSFIPYVCNEKNKIYPKLGEIKLSSPNNLGRLIKEFIDYLEMKNKKDKIMKKHISLNNWINKRKEEGLRECVKRILSNDFKEAGDGLRRGMFILSNELKRVLGVSTAEVVIKDWNSRMGFPINDKDIEYRMKTKEYSLSCMYIHKFLEELGIEVPEKCKGKVYK